MDSAGGGAPISARKYLVLHWDTGWASLQPDDSIEVICRYVTAKGLRVIFVLCRTAQGLKAAVEGCHEFIMRQKELIIGKLPAVGKAVASRQGTREGFVMQLNYKSEAIWA